MVQIVMVTSELREQSLPTRRNGSILKPILRKRTLSSSVMISESVGSSDGSRSFCTLAKAFSAFLSFCFAYITKQRSPNASNQTPKEDSTHVKKSQVEISDQRSSFDGS